MFVSFACSAGAEVVLDGSFGTSGPLPGPDVTIAPGVGRQVGPNLFHSFQTFNLSSAESATFTGPAMINYVLARVTGGSASSIDGLLRSEIPTATLFFINPNGVMFGPNAQVDVDGAFHVSSADFVRLAETGRFDASDPGQSVLTMDPPTTFGFISGTPGTLSFIESTLQVPDGATLSAVGGDIDIDRAHLIAPDGVVNVVSVASAGEFPIDEPSSLGEGFSEMGTISLSDTAVSFDGNLHTSGDGGGRIFVRSGEFFMQGGQVLSVITGGVGGGEIDIRATGGVAITGPARIDARSFGTGDAGNVAVDAESISLSGDARIETDTQTTADAGNITLTADAVSAVGSANINADALGSGSGGAITVDAESVRLDGDVFVSARTAFSGSGNAGRVIIRADSLVSSGKATIDTSTFFESSGGGGLVDIDVNTVNMSDEAWVISNTFTTESGGTIQIDANELVMSGKTAIATTSFSDGSGGQINIRAGRIELRDSAVISSGAEGMGTGGDVVVSAETMILTDDVTVSSQSEGENFFVRGVPLPDDLPGGGDAGDLSLQAGSLLMLGRAHVSSATNGVGDGGDLSIAITNLRLEDESRISAISQGDGLAGGIEVNAGDDVRLLGGSITTAADSSDGGNIVLNATTLLYLLGGEISTAVSDGDGDGGNISIDPVFVVLNNSNIVANARGGDGGNILIVADAFFIDENSIIDASSELGIDGTVIIRAPNEDVTASVVALPTGFLVPAELVSKACETRTRADLSSLVVAGRESAPPMPDDLHPSRVARTAGTVLPVALRSGYRRVASGPESAAPTPVHVVMLRLDCAG